MGYSKKYLPLFIGLAMGAGVFLGSKLNFSNPSAKLFSYNAKKEKLNRLIDYIDYEYVDEINTDSIVDVTVNRILENLDPHSVYIPPEELEGITESMQGDFIGIGVSYYPYRDTISVINTIKGGPSERSGILAGDRILMADQDTLYGERLRRDGLADKLKGELNSQVQLKVYRKGTGIFDVVVKRGRVPLRSVDASYMLKDKLGYIKVNRFAETTYKEFKKALDSLQDLGAENLVVDLRDNGGGFIAPALKMADEFLKNDELIMFTKNKKGAIENNYATRNGSFEKGNVYVLINENSASASEIFAGAIQDNDRGTIVGRRSYGKGLVQREMALGDGSAIRLTISRYYTPTGRSIQKPYENGNKEYFNEYLERYKNGELQNADSIQVADSLKFKTPGGKTVYGGGGIIPDIFVSKDTTRVGETLDYMLRSGRMGGYIFEELDKKRPFYNELTEEQFKEEIRIDDDFADGFLVYTRKNGIDINLKNYREQLKKYLKAIMAQQLFGTSEFEKIINEDDKMIQKVLSISD
ncbi:S41 family peptidase [Aquimarina sp. MMG015]|uniref:S41 family peptidase n=1 Tax=Aquimarina TaxID=290174 RepID=UPI00042A6ABB|nr:MULTISPECIES: S41 family peptidase [Aquimarina]AXT57672.1 S41 family peptidase [Aquimarina sp. AD1]MBQ4805464.1 S41 family peptidase [Aquimarina sp. MMG015]RKN34314.1 S41 family peptidase [Aquimarina sp. AD1]